MPDVPSSIVTYLAVFASLLDRTVHLHPPRLLLYRRLQRLGRRHHRNRRRRARGGSQDRLGDGAHRLLGASSGGAEAGGSRGEGQRPHRGGEERHGRGRLGPGDRGVAHLRRRRGIVSLVVEGAVRRGLDRISQFNCPMIDERPKVLVSRHGPI